jgi:ribonuclease PH
MMRPDHRANNALRPVSIIRNYTKFAEGSVLVSFGDTKVICTASLDKQVPPFLRDTGTGWVTAEYAMLPRATQERSVRDSMKKGRALEIGRLIGRALRTVVDLAALGERQIIVDCDVVQADGGTRTAAITGAYVALHDAVRHLLKPDIPHQLLPLAGQCAAVSLGIVDGEILLDLCYEEDSRAEVDMSLVMREDNTIIELQGTAEKKTFPRALLEQMLDLGTEGVRQLIVIQNEALGCA